MRKVREEELVGKTIKSIKNDTINSLMLEFSDGTKVELFSEVTGPIGLSSIVVFDDNYKEDN